MAYRSIINGQNGQPFIEAAIDAVGPMTNPQRLPADILARFDDNLPRALIDVWENQGIGDLDKGRLRLCIPGALRTPVNTLFGQDPYFAGQVQAIAFGAFGDLILWHDTYQIVYVNMQLAFVEMPVFFQPITKTSDDDAIYHQFLKMQAGALDAYDDTGTPMYDNAIAAHDELKELQIFGMNPPAPFHEAYSLDRHHPTDVIEWLGEKFAATTFTLNDPATGRGPVRNIGPLLPGEELRRPGEL